MKKILVQKYGGVTVADPEKIKSAAQSIFQLSRSGYQVIVVVSAMGKTTNELITLAQKVSEHPDPREMDMLLSTGERISMALLSMAIHDLGGSAISFTGSQAGIMTNESHINAQIEDVKAFRVAEALAEGKVVVLAGFQGVSPKTKEITTLGRGGSDTSAVALAAAFQAERCEILKDVSGVMTADPKKVPEAKRIENLSYQQMLEMTFWGAQVLHYRSVELATIKKVPIYVGPASTTPAGGTMISAQSNSTFESSKVLAVNSHSTVLEIIIPADNCSLAWSFLIDDLQLKKISFPQLLFSRNEKNNFVLFVTGPQEWVASVLANMNGFEKIKVQPKMLSTISLTCTGVTQPELIKKVCVRLVEQNIQYKDLILSGLTLTLFVDQAHEGPVLKLMHKMIEEA